MNNSIQYFNMFNDGDRATVRLLHTSTNTIESAKVHFVNVGGKKKQIKCCGDGCPMCARNESASDRIFIHLYDYADNTEKVWCRTGTILNQLRAIEQQIGNLNSVVFDICRVGKDFPKYAISVNGNSSNMIVPNIKCDDKIAYRFYLSRSASEMNEFYNTGVMPQHASNYVPKSEYFKNKQNNQSYGTTYHNNQQYQQNTNAVQNNYTQPNIPNGMPYKQNGGMQQTPVYQNNYQQGNQNYGNQYQQYQQPIQQTPVQEPYSNMNDPFSDPFLSNNRFN